MKNREPKVGRRAAIATGLVSATATAGLVASASIGSSTAPHGEARRSPLARGRMPVVYLPHGGGPWPFVDMGFDRAEIAALSGYLASIRSVAGAPPQALLVISAHWEEKVPTVMSAARPPILYDYYGFPPASYEITWPAPGDPALAARVRTLVEEAGFSSAEDTKRGFDHGTFIPLKLTFPDADVPTLQLSMLSSLDPAEHLRLGRAIAKLRDEGVLIVGSGMSYHNMRGFRDGRGRAVSEAFDKWLGDAVVQGAAERDRLLSHWVDAPGARAAHPREEHLLPLMVVAGAAGNDPGAVAWNGSFMGVRLSGVHFGAAS
jgi:aromatic ring-opening dioxygenase catalytic subunit (LigB family)